MDIDRPFWRSQLEVAWKKSPIVWLAGVRRSGKTTLVKSLKEGMYLNCDLPSVREALENPENFYKNNPHKLYIFDEIHQLPEASLLLKIGADILSKTRFLATGSSTLIASKKFKDTLSGRKRNIHFTPVLAEELAAFNRDLKTRLLRGGLPPALLADEIDTDFYAEWLDSFYARDIQELFFVEKRQPFLKAIEYLMASNGSQFEVTKLAQASGVTRPTMIKYLDILEVTKAICLVRPYSKNAEQEIVSQPKVYAFDTGFFCFVQNIKDLRTEEAGKLLENLTLETLIAYGLQKQIRYWRTKSKIEIDFVICGERDIVHVIECKWKEKSIETSAIEQFRLRYPKGKNFIVTSDSVTRILKEKSLEYSLVPIFELSKVIKELKI